MIGERWQCLDGYAGYEVSDRGRVLMLRGWITSGYDTGHGYRKVTLCRGAEHHTQYVHRLVARSFIPNPLGLPEVNHIDADRGNNCATNLEWVDRTGNARHARDLGLVVLPGLRGQDHPAAKLTDESVREIYARYAAGGVSQMQLANEYGVAQSQIWTIVAGRRWTHLTGGTPARTHALRRIR